MNKNITLLKLLISCPSDIKEEVQILKDIISNQNNIFISSYRLVVQPIHWSSSSYSATGGSGQGVLNKQIVEDSDMLVALFWTKFGTPTINYLSGTEEEIMTMIENGKQVFLYFLDYPIPPSEIDNEQYQNIENFKEKYKTEGFGLYKEIKTKEELKEVFSRDLEMYIGTNKEKFLGSSNKEQDVALKYPKTKLLDSIPNFPVEINVISNKGKVNFELFEEDLYKEIIFGKDIFSIDKDTSGIYLSTSDQNAEGIVSVIKKI